jgi:predicted transposase/invertase (TIGR01784 family)
MVYVTGDDEAIRAYEMRQMALSDYTSAINYARDEGMAKGIEKGTLEIARKMKNAGRPLSEIAEFTGLPVRTIERLQK